MSQHNHGTAALMHLLYYMQVALVAALAVAVFSVAAVTPVRTDSRWYQASQRSDMHAE